MNLTHKIKLFIAQKTGRVAKKADISDLYAKEDKEEVKDNLLIEIEKRMIEIEEEMLANPSEKLEVEYKKLKRMKNINGKE